MTEEKRVVEQVAAHPEVMTVEQVAVYLQVSKRTVYNMAAAGEMPAAKVGEQWRFYRPEIDQWLIRLSRANVGDPTPAAFTYGGGAVNGEV